MLESILHFHLHTQRHERNGRQIIALLHFEENIYLDIKWRGSFMILHFQCPPAPRVADPNPSFDLERILREFYFCGVGGGGLVAIIV